MTQPKLSAAEAKRRVLERWPDASIVYDIENRLFAVSKNNWNEKPDLISIWHLTEDAAWMDAELRTRPIDDPDRLPEPTPEGEKLLQELFAHPEQPQGEGEALEPEEDEAIRSGLDDVANGRIKSLSQIEEEIEQPLWFHGTTSEKAAIIRTEGFAVDTWFARHMEDAVKFGGPHVFVVKMKIDRAPLGWQIHMANAMPPSIIVDEVVVKSPTPPPQREVAGELPPLDAECIGLERTRDPLECRERQLRAALQRIREMER